MANPIGPDRKGFDHEVFDRAIAHGVQVLEAPLRLSTKSALHNLWNRISDIPSVQKVGFTELTGRDLDLYVFADPEDIKGQERIQRHGINYNRRTSRDLPVNIHIVLREMTVDDKLPIAHVVFDRNEQAKQSTLP